MIAQAPSSAATKAAPAGDPDVNPFQVYPVRGLSELSDIRLATVKTPEVQAVEAAVKEYARTFEEAGSRLLLAAKGDFGTGKTHLMLYAAEMLRLEMDATPPATAAPTSYPRTPFAVLAVSTEAPIEEWYASELGPVLMEIASPRELVRELLTRVACEVAAADRDPEVAALANTFRSSRKALYNIFRNPGSFDVSKVEERFRAEIERACPRTSWSFRRAIEALRWEETADLVEDWLAGNELSAEDVSRIGIRLEPDRARRAADAICAIASLCKRLGRPFALFIDEFEHLTRYDRRQDSKRNITWVKRLVEALARRGAVVFISGHWEAWAQQDDFLDRFVGGRPIQLVRLNWEDVQRVVEVRAGSGSWPGFTEQSARSVVEATSGNIRRVMTVLYDLWATSPPGRTDIVTDNAVRIAAQRRLQPGSEIGIMPAIEAAILAAGAELQRNEPLGTSHTKIDATARVGGELRLLVQLVHARDELSLINDGEKFARFVKELRASHKQLRGLCVTLGAVIEKHLLTLDAAFPETDLVNGEDPEAVKRLPEIVTKMLERPMPVAVAVQAEARQKLDETRSAVVERADAQIARSENIFADDVRSEAVRQLSVADSEDLASQKAEVARDKLFQLLTGNAEDWQGPFRAGVLNWSILMPFVLGVILIGLSVWLPSLAATDPAPLLQFSPRILAPVLLGGGLLSVFVGIVLATRLAVDLREFSDFHVQTLERAYADGKPSGEISRVNDLLENSLLRYGPRGGRRFASEEMTRSSRPAPTASASVAPNAPLPTQALPPAQPPVPVSVSVRPPAAAQEALAGPAAASSSSPSASAVRR